MSDQHISSSQPHGTRLADARIKRVLDKYMQVPELTTKLVGNSFLNDKMKRTYLRIVDERVKRFIRDSE
jgi:serine/threonine-protein kinase HipA